MYTITLALGSNHMLHRAYFRQAIRLLSGHIEDIHISSLYETVPVGKTMGGNFFNMVLQGKTMYSPQEFIAITQGIEKYLGRTYQEHDIAREIDIDIIFHGTDTYTDEQITVPHPRRQERDFVLAPLIELDPQQRYQNLLEKVGTKNILQIYPWITYPTKIVGILNVSPDSFSDGQKWTAILLHQRIEQLIQAGADMIDIGAESTAPGSIPVDEEQELSRLKPVFDILSRHTYPVQFSLDTTKASIAEQGIMHGFEYINDVSGGRKDPGMYTLLAQYPHIYYIIMYAKNSTGRADLNKRTSQVSILDDLTDFFEVYIEKALQAGIDEGQLILDPGMGAFISPDRQDSVAIIRGIKEIKEKFTLPVFVGTSRKGFLGKITPDTGPVDRIGNSLASSWKCVQGGADYIRIHDVLAMKQFLDIAHLTSDTP